MLKDFASRSDFSDWFSRDDEPNKAAVILKPNPRNTELEEKMATLGDKIARYVTRFYYREAVSDSNQVTRR